LKSDEEHDENKSNKRRKLKKTAEKNLKKKKLIFPQRLLDILSREEFSQIISWLPHGKFFSILDRKKLIEIVLPKYFKKSMFTSFTRKLNRWGFVRVGKGADSGAYFHQYFHRDKPSLCLKMKCQKKYERRRIPPSLEKISKIQGIKSKTNIFMRDSKLQSIYQVPIMNPKRREEHRLLMAAAANAFSTQSSKAQISSSNLMSPVYVPLFNDQKSPISYSSSSPEVSITHYDRDAHPIWRKKYAHSRKRGSPSTPLKSPPFLTNILLPPVSQSDFDHKSPSKSFQNDETDTVKPVTSREEAPKINFSSAA